MKKFILFIAALLCIAVFAFTFVENKNGSHDTDTKTKQLVIKVLDDYMSTFNAHDLKGWEGTYHFPHHRLAGGMLTTLERAGLRDSAKVFAALESTGWHHSKWDHRNIIQASEDKIHVDTQFSRYRVDGTKVGSYESLYILTRENGRWAVKMRSSYAE